MLHSLLTVVVDSMQSALSLANFSLLVWTGLGIVSPVSRAITVRGLMTPGVLTEMSEVRKHFVALTGLVAGTIFAGSLVAEIDGGREFQTFPKMGNRWIPHGLFEHKVSRSSNIFTRVLLR